MPFDDANDDDKPPEEDLWDERPIRRDVEPHRGGYILGYGVASILASFACCVFPLLSVVGIGLGIAAWIMARGDLRKMHAGSMDTDGRGQTKAGSICGIFGVGIGITALLGMAVYIAVYFFFMFMQGRGSF